MRSAAIQVEMDEFMTLRRLNLRIQGFPESYAAEAYTQQDMVVGEPHPYTVSSAHPPPQALMTDGSMGMPPQESITMMNSPMRSSPLAEDPISGAA